jgi:hypothetical protein
MSSAEVMRLSDMQKQSLFDILKGQMTCGLPHESPYAYVEIDNRGWKHYHPRQINALIDKGLIYCTKPMFNGPERRVRAVQNIDCVFGRLTQMGWTVAIKRGWVDEIPDEMVF